MASRSGPGAGVYITVTILGVLTLTLFALTIVFASKYQNAAAQVSDQEQQISGFITRTERQNDEFLRIRSVAQNDGKSAMQYLSDTSRDLTAKVTGVATDSPSTIANKLQPLVSESESLMQAIRDRDRQITQLTAAVTSAQAAQAQARADLAAESEKSRNRENVFNDMADSLNASVDRYKNDVDALRQEATDYRNQVAQHEEDLKQNHTQQVSAFQSRLSDKDAEIFRLQRQLDDCRARTASDTLSPNTEYALVDGSIIGLNTSQDYVYIGIGANDKVQLGMTFSVYSQPTDIRPDAAGNYPRPKAGIEVIEIDETHSTCRVVPGTQLRGDPLIVGDVIANPIYDPNKVYKFVVFGDFDTNGDGVPRPQEAQTVKGVIRQWGGEVIDDLTGDVDFLVLGVKPALPIAPQPDSPIEVFQAYTAKKAAADRYDKLWNDALKTRIPVLNMNRLYTLTGKTHGYLR